MAHSHKIVHRDLKPGNILGDLTGHWYVADFGLAKRLDRTVSHSSPNAGRGTQAYASPEQLNLEDVTARTDIFALGLILFEAVTGQRAFDSETTDGRAEKILHQEGIGTRKNRQLLGKPLFAIVSKCLQRYPEHRYESVELLQKDLASFLAGRDVSVRPPSLWEEIRYLFQRRKKSLSMILGALIASVALLVLYVDGSAKRKLGIELHRQGLVTSAMSDLVAKHRDSRDAAIGKLTKAIAIRNDKDLLEPFIAAQLKQGFVRQWVLPGKPHLGFDVSDDGQNAAIARDDGGITIMRRGSTESIVLAPKVKEPALFLQWSPSGQHLAAMHRLPPAAPKTARRPFFVWNTNTNTKQTLTSVPAGIQDEGWAFTPKGDAIFVADAAINAIRRIDLNEDRAVDQFSIPSGQWVRGLAIGPGQDWVAIAMADTRVVEIRALAEHPAKKAGELIDRWQVPAEILDLDVSAAGNLAVTAGKDLFLFDSGNSQATSILHAHDFPVDRVRFSNRGDRILTRDLRRHFKIWNVADATLMLRGASTRHVKFVKHDREIAGLVSDVGFAVDALAQDELRPSFALPAWQGGARGVCFHGDGSKIYVACNDGLIAWNIDANVLSPQIVDDLVCGDVETVAGKLYSTHRFRVTQRTLDRKSDAKNGPDATLSFSTPDHHYGSPLAVSRDGSRIAVVVRATNSVKVIGANRSVTFPAANVSALAISPDGKWLATASSDLESGTRILELGDDLVETDAPPVYALPPKASNLTFLMDSRSLVVGTAESYEVWDIHSQKKLEHFHHDRASTDAPCALSTDGGLLAITLSDGAIQINDTKTWEKLYTLGVPSNQIQKLAFSFSGNELAALLNNGVALVWRLDELFRRCQQAGFECDWLSQHRTSNPPVSSVSVAGFAPSPAASWLPSAKLSGPRAAPIHREIESLRAQAKSEPENAVVRTTLARKCLQLGGWGEALRQFQQACEIEPDSSRLYFVGLLHATLGATKEYHQLLQSVDTGSFNDDGQEQLLTRLCLLKPDVEPSLVESAFAAINKQLDAAPRNEWLQTIKALALVRCDRPQEGLAIFRESVDGDWGKLDSFEKAIVALALRRSGNDREADEVLKSYRRYPGHRFPDLRLYAQQLVSEASKMETK